MTDIRLETIRWDNLVASPSNWRTTWPLSSAVTGLGRVLTYAFDPSYRYLAVFDPGHRQVIVFDRTSHQVAHQVPMDLLSEDPSVNWLRFSPSGAMLIAASLAPGGELAVWSLSGARSTYQTADVARFDVSPDDRWLALARRNGIVELIDLRDSGQGPSTTFATVPEWLSFSPDARHLAVCFGSSAPVVSILDGESLELVTQWKLTDANVQHVAWHPDGEVLTLARGGAGRAEVWSLAEQRCLTRTATGPSWVAWCSVDPLGEFLVTSAWDGTTRLWRAHSGRLILTLERGIPLSPWKPDGTVLGSRQTDEGIELIHVERGQAFGLLQGPFYEAERSWLAKFNPDGRLVVASLQNGNSPTRRVVLWDVATRRQLGGFQANRVAALWFQEQDLSLIHQGGLTRLPGRWRSTVGQIDNRPERPTKRLIADKKGKFPTDRSLDATSRSRMGEGHGETIAFGPPHTNTHVQEAVAASTNGSICAIIRGRRLIVSNSSDPAMADQAVEEAGIDDGASFELPGRHDSVLASPNGRWVVTGGWHSPVTCIWDVTRQCLTKELRLGGQTGFYFPPDGSQLVTCRWDAYRFWNLETMENVLTLPRADCPQPDAIAVSPSGTLAVVRLRPDTLDVISLPTGQTQLRLQGPRLGRPNLLEFSPDETKILVADANHSTLGIWDLTLLSQELSDLGLPNEELAGPWKPDASRAVFSVHFEGVEALAPPTFIGGMDPAQARQKLQALQRAYTSKPQSALAANDLAWNLVTAPLELRDTRRALELAEQAVRSEPSSTTYRNTLGAALYRAGEFDRAVALLEPNVAAAPNGQLPFDLLFLAMCHAAAGRQPQAEVYLQMAERWLAIAQDDPTLIADRFLPELEVIRAEAEATVSPERYGPGTE